MAKYSYNTILNKAKNIKQNVEKEYKLGEGSNWSYYFCKALLKPKTDITKLNISSAPSPTGDYISNQIYKSTFMDMGARLIKYVEANGQLPNYITAKADTKTYKIGVKEYTYMFARVLIYYHTNGKLPTYANVNSKAFTKPTESTNDVYDYFVKVFGKISCIDDALDKISGRGYGYYYDDQYSNKTSIDRMKNYQGVNCTDSMQVFYNLMLAFIKQGKYKKVECLHVKCSGGDGHVRMRVTKNDGTTFLRDPACTLNSGGYCNWCTSNYTFLAIDPSWFKENLNR